jgi:hypothetical protein
MKLRKEVVTIAVLALVLAVALIGAVGAEVASPLAVQDGVITDLRMSDSCDGPAIELFPAGVETVYVVFDYSDMQGEPYRIKVADRADIVILHDESHSYTESGTECIPITHTSGHIPPDTYQTQIFSGGHLPIKTLLWHVRPGGPGEITSLHMSLSSDGPPKTEFKEGIRTVWAVFDYSGMEGNEVGIEIYRRIEEGNKSLVQESSRVSLSGSGTTSTSVTHSLIAGYPAGPYSTHVVKDGFVDAITDWYVLHVVYLPLVVKNDQ